MQQYVFAADNQQFEKWLHQNYSPSCSPIRISHPHNLRGAEINGVTTQVVILPGWDPPDGWTETRVLAYLRGRVRSTGELNRDNAIVRFK